MKSVRFKFRAKEQELLDILNRGGIYSTTKLSKEMRLVDSKVRALVHSIRYKFLDGFGDTYIYSTPTGYTIEESKENTIYESNMRMKLGFGVLLNGAHIFKRAKMIAPKEFRGITVQYKPMSTQKLLGGK